MIGYLELAKDAGYVASAGRPTARRSRWRRS